MKKTAKDLLLILIFIGLVYVAGKIVQEVASFCQDGTVVQGVTGYTCIKD